MICIIYLFFVVSGTIISITVPALYSKYRTSVDKCYGVIHQKFSDNYKIMDESFLCKVPRSLSKEKDTWSFLREVYDCQTCLLPYGAKLLPSSLQGWILPLCFTNVNGWKQPSSCNYGSKQDLFSFMRLCFCHRVTEILMFHIFRGLHTI